MKWKQVENPVKPLSIPQEMWDEILRMKQWIHEDQSRLGLTVTHEWVKNLSKVLTTKQLEECDSAIHIWEEVDDTVSFPIQKWEP